MFFRALAYIALGWVCIAAVPALARVFELSVMLPSVSAVLLTHLAFRGQGSLPWGLAVAISFGYLEDLHQGAPFGTLTLACAVSFLVMRWAAARIALPGLFSRIAAVSVGAALIDVCTWGILTVLAEGLGRDRGALLTSLWDARWHVAASALLAPPLWLLAEKIFRVSILQPQSLAGEGLSLDLRRKVGEGRKR